MGSFQVGDKVQVAGRNEKYEVVAVMWDEQYVRVARLIGTWHDGTTHTVHVSSLTRV